MKLSRVSRKSLPIYLLVFFFMLFFEAQRMTPFLEREGANYPFLLNVNSSLQKIGEKSGLYTLSDKIRSAFSQFAEDLSANQNLSRDFSLPSLSLPSFSFDKQEIPAEKTQTQEQEKQDITAENTAENMAVNTVTDNTATDKTTKELAKPVQSETPQKQENSPQPEKPAPSRNELNYPYNPSLVLAPASPTASPIYNALIPDYGKKKTVLLIGDSMMMEGLGPTLHHRLRKRDNLAVFREGKYSSGLSRPDFYDWNVNILKFLDKYQPDLLIMSLGANDTQDIVIEKKRHFIDSKSWAETYLQRSKDFIALADNGKRRILWVSLPVMGKEPYFTRTQLISRLQAEASKDIDRAKFVNIEHLLTENGKYTTFYKDKDNKSIRLRSQDLIHVSNEGGEILTDYLIPYVDKELNALYAEDVPLAYPPVAGMANRVTFTSSLRQKEAEYFVWLPETKTTLDSTEQSDINKTVKAQLADKRYPILYLLHGAYSSAKDYADAMGKDLQKIADKKKVIIVAPSCEPFGWYVDSPLVGENQIESFITKELVPHIDSLYPTNKKRAVAGLSMGGHGAMLLGFYHRDLFQSMASISGVLDIRVHKDSWKIKDLLGELDTTENTGDKTANEKNNDKIRDEIRKNWDKYAVQAIIAQKWPATSPKHIQIVTGTEDTLVLEENRRAQDLLHKRGFKFQYTEKPGIHNWQFWQENIPPILENQADYLHGL